jgi:hypothetical protein
MPTLVCHACGRVVYTTAPLGSLFPEERRCPRCGAFLENDHREGSRRHVNRRQQPADDPGPPGGAERRVADRRVTKRRKSDRGSFSS